MVHSSNMKPRKQITEEFYNALLAAFRLVCRVRPSLGYYLIATGEKE